jgi:hypothetical protein
MRRHILGIIALLFLLSGLAFWLCPSTGGYEQYQAECWRTGSVLIMLWLAYPDLRRVPVWALLVVPVVVIVVLRRPRWLWTLIPALILVAALKPKPPRRVANQR